MFKKTRWDSPRLIILLRRENFMDNHKRVYHYIYIPEALVSAA